jgi:hypothetical protein
MKRLSVPFVVLALFVQASVDRFGTTQAAEITVKVVNLQNVPIQDAISPITGQPLNIPVRLTILNRNTGLAVTPLNNSDADPTNDFDPNNINTRGQKVVIDDDAKEIEFVFDDMDGGRRLVTARLIGIANATQTVIVAMPLQDAPTCYPVYYTYPAKHHNHKWFRFSSH